MSETSTTTTTELTSQYTAQVTSDLERNAKEQERVGAEIAALQEQLATLQVDYAVLVNMQQALGVAPAPAQPAAEPDSATVPAPRRKRSIGVGTSKRTRGKKSGAEQEDTTAGKRTGGKAAAKKGAGRSASAKASGPTLVELVRSHLTGQSEPRSAAEVAATLGQAHPERGIKTTVVRTTLEGLVAKNHAHRTKQGTSVFYTAPDGADATARSEDEALPDQAG
ncbi:hypothetical protein ABZ468_22305 [Streptomyces sp. NPDC005708]|uniref:hypothetical protein n=1 Tax=unclassified Streptomyces TaxID=2593676 RepID=UPI0033C62BA3